MKVYGGDWHPAPEDVRVGGNPCIDTLVPSEERIRRISDDRSIVTSYAIVLPGIGHIAPEQWLAREVGRRLFALVASPLRLCPGGKVLVVVEEDGDEVGRHWRLKAVSCSLLAKVDDILSSEDSRARWPGRRGCAQNCNQVPRSPCCSTPAFDQSHTPCGKTVCKRVACAALNGTL